RSHRTHPIRQVADLTSVFDPLDAASRVHVPGTSAVHGFPAVTDELDGELARLQDRSTGGMAPLAMPCACAGSTALRPSGRSPGSHASRVAAVAHVCWKRQALTCPYLLDAS